MILAGVALAGTPLTVMPAAQSMPVMMSESVPPHTPSARTGKICGFQVTPATPSELLVSAPSMPATRVPCQELTCACVWLAHSALDRSALLIQSPGSEASAPGQVLLLATNGSEMKQ